MTHGGAVIHIKCPTASKVTPRKRPMPPGIYKRWLAELLWVHLRACGNVVSLLTHLPSVLRTDYVSRDHVCRWCAGCARLRRRRSGGRCHFREASNAHWLWDAQFIKWNVKSSPCRMHHRRTRPSATHVPWEGGSVGPALAHGRSPCSDNASRVFRFQLHRNLPLLYGTQSRNCFTSVKLLHEHMARATI